MVALLCGYLVMFTLSYLLVCALVVVLFAFCDAGFCLGGFRFDSQRF